MDMVKMGSFLAELRKEHNLTQAELGEKLGVTNKTVSRWETGNYMPPIEMLEQLSDMYGLTINELISGSKLSTEDYKTMAEANIKETLQENVFLLKLRGMCNFFWKRCYLFIPLLLIVFFGLGYFNLRNRLIADSYNLYGELTHKDIRKMSLECGITWAFFYTAITLLVLFAVTVITAKKKKSVDPKDTTLKKLRFTRRIFLAPYVISIIICLVSAIVGVSGGFFGEQKIYLGMEALAGVALILALYLWWLYIICFIGIVVTSVKIMKRA